MAGPRNAIGVVGNSSGTAVPVTSTSDTRLGLAGLVNRKTATQAGAGIFKGPGGYAVSGTSGWAYQVAPGIAVIAADSSAGAYIVPSMDTITVSCPSAPASGYERLDYICLVQDDAWDRTATSTAAYVQVYSGAAATSNPPAPTGLPDNYILLATNVMTSAATTTASSGNTITNGQSPTIVATGGVRVYASQTQQNADVILPGDVFYRSDSDAIYAQRTSTVDALAYESTLEARTLNYNAANFGTMNGSAVSVAASTVGTVLSWTGVQPAAGSRVKLMLFTTISVPAAAAGAIKCLVDGVQVGSNRRLQMSANNAAAVENNSFSWDFVLGSGSHTIQVTASPESASNTWSFANTAADLYYT